MFQKKNMFFKKRIALNLQINWTEGSVGFNFPTWENLSFPFSSSEIAIFFIIISYFC